MMELINSPVAHRGDIINIVQIVFQTMLEMETFDTEPIQLPPGGITVAVYFAATWNGALVFECPAEQALDLTSRFLGIERPDEVNSEVQDTLGEIANMIADNLKPFLGSGVALSMPSVIQGADYLLRVCGAAAHESISFLSDLGPFRVILFAVPAPDGNSGTLTKS